MQKVRVSRQIPSTSASDPVPTCALRCPLIWCQHTASGLCCRPDVTAIRGRSIASSLSAREPPVNEQKLHQVGRLNPPVSDVACGCRQLRGRRGAAAGAGARAGARDAARLQAPLLHQVLLTICTHMTLCHGYTLGISSPRRNFWADLASCPTLIGFGIGRCALTYICGCS